MRVFLKVTSFFILLMGMIICISGCSSGCLSCDQILTYTATLQHSAVQPVSRIEPNKVNWWQERMDSVNAQVQKGDVDLILIGDSITHGWENVPDLWDKYFGKWNTVNAGFGGDRTQHVLWRLEHGNIDGISPKAAVLMIGTNNSNDQDNTAEEIADGIKAIVCTLREKLPETKILILAIFPRGDTQQRKVKDMDAIHNSQWSKNDQASQLASKLADNKMIFYLDINDVFLTDGILTREVMPDLLHPQEKGYMLWGDAMAPTLKKLMAK